MSSPCPVIASMVARATSLACAPVCVIGPAQVRLAATRKTTTKGLSRTSPAALSSYEPNRDQRRPSTRSTVIVSSAKTSAISIT